MLFLKPILVYLTSHVKRKIIYNTTMPDLSQYEIKEYSRFQYYPDTVEAFSPNAPVPKERLVVVNGYFDASHASCLVTKRVVPSIFLFINSISIECYSKLQELWKRQPMDLKRYQEEYL